MNREGKWCATRSLVLVGSIPTPNFLMYRQADSQIKKFRGWSKRLFSVINRRPRVKEGLPC